MNAFGAYPATVQTNQQVVIELISSNVTNHQVVISIPSNVFQRLSEPIRNYFTTVILPRDSLAVVNIIVPRDSLAEGNILTNFDSVRAREAEARDELQRYCDISAGNLGCVDFWKKASSVSFILAAAIAAGITTAAKESAAVAGGAAAAATILFGGLGKWMHSNLQRKTSAVKKDIDVVGSMVEGAEVIIRDLDEIKALASSYQDKNKLLLEIANGGRATEEVLEQERAALAAIFQEFEGKVQGYSRHVSWAKEKAVNSITQNYGT